MSNLMRPAGLVPQLGACGTFEGVVDRLERLNWGGTGPSMASGSDEFTGVDTGVAVGRSGGAGNISVVARSGDSDTAMLRVGQFNNHSGIQELLALSGPYREKAYFGISSSEYAQRFLAVQSVDDLMRTVLELHPGAIYYTDPNIFPTQTNMEEADKSPQNFPSYRLLGLKSSQAIEFNKLALSLWIIVSLLRDDFSLFSTKSGPILKGAVLTDDQLKDLKACLLEVVGSKVGNGDYAVDPDKLRAFVTNMVVHDLGRSKAIADAMVEILGAANVPDGHDEVLALAMELGFLQQIVPSLNFLSPDGTRLNQSTISAAKDVNFGQLTQGEDWAAMVAGFGGLKRDEVFFLILHLMLDQFGCKGHIMPNSAFLATSFIYRGYQMALPILSRVAGENDEGLDPVKAANEILLETVRSGNVDLDMDTNEGIAKARLLGHLLTRIPKGLDSAGVGVVFEHVWSGFTQKQPLIESLSRTGIGRSSPAINDEIAPQMIENAVAYYILKKNMAPALALETALNDCFMFMSKVMTKINADIADQPDSFRHKIKVQFQRVAADVKENGSLNLADATFRMDYNSDRSEVVIFLEK